MILIVYIIYIMLQPCDILNWKSVTDALYPRWYYNTSEAKTALLYPPVTNDRWEPIDRGSIYNIVFKQEIELDLNARVPIPAPSKENLEKYQPRIWMMDAQEQNRADVLEFLLRNGLVLSARFPAFDEYDSELALELRTHARSQFVALYLLYEPIEAATKVKMMWTSLFNTDVHSTEVYSWLIKYMYVRLKNGLALFPEYDTYQGFGVPFYVY